MSKEVAIYDEVAKCGASEEMGMGSSAFDLLLDAIGLLHVYIAAKYLLYVAI